MTATETKQLNNVWNQYYATFAANLIILAHGAILGWVSPALPILSSLDTPLSSGPLTSEQVSWIGSINCVAAIFGTLSISYMISRMGSKRAILVISIPCTVFWLLIYFGDDYYHIFIARLFSGFAGGGVLTSLILYISEIANDDIRGRLGSSGSIIRNIGILIGYVFGAGLDYKTIPCISGVFPVIFFILFAMLPNTPRFHLQRGQTEKAEEALKYYSGYKGKSKQEDEAFYKEFERLKAIASEQKAEEKLQASDFFNRKALKGIGIGMALTTSAQFTANFTLTNYAVMIFERSGAELDPYVSSIMLAVALILGSIFTTYLADSLGRKFLNVISLLGSAAGLFAVCIYHYLNLQGCDLSSFVWVPVVSLSFVIFISSVGIMPLSLICSVEYLPPKIRTFGIAIICLSINIFTFFCVKLFPILLDIIDVHGCFMIFGTGCVIGAIFIVVVVEETSGQSLDDVGLDEQLKMKRIHAARLNSICSV